MLIATAARPVASPLALAPPAVGDASLFAALMASPDDGPATANDDRQEAAAPGTDVPEADPEAWLGAVLAMPQAALTVTTPGDAANAVPGGGGFAIATPSTAVRVGAAPAPATTVTTPSALLAAKPATAPAVASAASVPTTAAPVGLPDATATPLPRIEATGVGEPMAGPSIDADASLAPQTEVDQSATAGAMPPPPAERRSMPRPVWAMSGRTVGVAAASADRAASPAKVGRDDTGPVAIRVIGLDPETAAASATDANTVPMTPKPAPGAAGSADREATMVTPGDRRSGPDQASSSSLDSLQGDPAVMTSPPMTATGEDHAAPVPSPVQAPHPTGSPAAYDVQTVRSGAAVPQQPPATPRAIPPLDPSRALADPMTVGVRPQVATTATVRPGGVESVVQATVTAEAVVKPEITGPVPDAIAPPARAAAMTSAPREDGADGTSPAPHSTWLTPPVEGDSKPIEAAAPRPVVAATASDTTMFVVPATATTATHHAAQTPVDMTRNEWPQAMIGHIERLRDAADAVDTRIRLHPDALGTIDVSLHRAADGVAVALEADRPATQAMLVEARPQLDDLAAARGLRLTGMGVDAGGDRGGAGSQRQPPPSPPPATPMPAQARTAGSDDHSDAPAAGRIA